MNKDWIEQADVWRRRYAPLTWIPLYLSRDRGEGQYGYEGYFTDIEAVRTVAVYEEHRAELDGVGFVDLPHCHGPNTWRGYSACDVYLSRDGKDVGAHIALHQSFDGDHPSLLSLNQDFVFALQLIREGDVWVRPGEGYAEVAKIERRADGVAEALLVRPEFLKDYLAARSMSLFIGSYRERRWIVPSLSSLPYKEDHDHDEVDQFGRHSFHVRPISVGGFPYGGGVAVFTAARNDRWADDEIPVLGPETEENVVSTSSTFRREGKKLFCITSERRSSEWLEPASTSQRVRHDDVPSRSYFLVDSQGASSNADELNREEIGLWLYFRPSVVPDILSRRGASIDWHTRFTASIQLPGGVPVHFGTNKADLVVVYAQDIARQPEWQRQIWVAYNTAPEGGLGEELEAAQVRTAPAGTHAPEAFIRRAQAAADQAFIKRWGVNLFRCHQDIDEIVSRTHRFRSLDRNGFLSLAKDLARLSADLIDQKGLHGIAPPENGQGTGSLRSLERVLATLVEPSVARTLTSKLAGIYELRLGDAHLPSAKLEEAISLSGVPAEGSWLLKGAIMIHSFVASLYEIAEVVGRAKEAGTRPED